MLHTVFEVLGIAFFAVKLLPVVLFALVVVFVVFPAWLIEELRYEAVPLPRKATPRWIDRAWRWFGNAAIAAFAVFLLYSLFDPAADRARQVATEQVR